MAYPSQGIALGVPWTRSSHTVAALCPRLSGIVIDGRRRALAFVATKPANIPPLACMAICGCCAASFACPGAVLREDLMVGGRGLADDDIGALPFT